MKILRIAAKNLASLAGEVEIPLDRGPLSQAGVFAITGPTGAGKSTLLDALCLALFDRTPRLGGGGAKVGAAELREADRLRAGDVRTILRKGATEAWAEVDFLDERSRRHRARWEVRRSRGRPDGRIQAQSMELTDLQSGERLATKKGEVLAAIEARLGLSFDQFRRSVLLAQGDFAAFLAAEERERAELLEKMTGTEIYGWISIEAHRRESEEQRLFEILEERLACVGRIPEEERLSLRARLPLLEAEAVALAERQRELEEAERRHAVLEALLEEEEEAVAKEAEAREAMAGWAEREAQLRELARVTPLRPLFAARADASAEAEAAEEARRGALRGVEEATREREEAEAEAARAQTALEEARALHLPDLERARQTLEEAEAQRRQAEAALAALDRRAVSEEGLSLERASAAIASLREAKGSFEGSRARRERALEEAEAQRALAAQRGSEAASLGERIREVELRIEEARGALERARAAIDLEAHRHALVDGEPCPLCGAEAHPWAEQLPPLSALLREQERRVGTLEAGREAIRQERSHLEAGQREALERRRGLLEASEREGEEIAASRTKWDKSAKNVVFLRKNTQIDEENSLSMIEEIEAELSLRQRAQARREASLAEAEARTKEARDEETRARASVSALELRLREAEAEAHRSLRAAEKATLTRRESEAEARARREIAEATAARSASRHGEQREALGAALAELGLREEEAAARLDPHAGGLSAADAEAWERRIRELREAATRAAAVLRERRRRREEEERRGPPAHPRAGLREALEGAGEGLLAARAEAHSIDRRLTLDEAAQRSAEELEGRLEAQRSKLDLYRTLSGLIGSADGKKLRVFAQSLTLDLLLGHANRHLRELSPRYSLERVPGHDLALQALDHEMGDEVRSVRSLSGGETFLVSLGLALGLATLTSERTRVDSLFIDEGFGSLDPESLEMALSTLDALQATGRQVGLISHVPAVAERFDVRVQVEAVSPSRSRVRVLPELLSEPSR